MILVETCPCSGGACCSIGFEVKKKMEVAVDAVGSAKDQLVGGVQSKASDQLVDSIWRQFGYVWNYSSNIHDFKDHVKKLKAERESVHHRADEARRNGEEVEEIVKTWLTTADETTKAADEILDENGTANKSCFMGLCPNLKTRYVLSRKAKKETPGVLEVREEGKFEKISYHIPSATLGIKHVRDYENFESRILIFNQIVRELKDSNCPLIGVYGTGGVGKTMLAERIAEMVSKDGIFKIVITVSVPQKPELRSIQQEIAEWLDLKFDTESTQIRSARLRLRLKQEEDILIILDDICERIELEDIGIPYGNDHKTCKILVISKNQKVLSKMGVEKDFKVEVLLEEEAWQLFEKKLGNTNLKDDPNNLGTIAVDVVKRCRGLPALIAAVASALRNKEAYEWMDLLNQMNQFEKLQLDHQINLILQY